MPISSILSGAASGTAAAAGSAAKGSGDAFAAILQRARDATSPPAGSATTGESVGNLTREAENQFSEFKRAMQQLLASAGIDTGWQLVLSSDGRGGITVNGDHPDKDKIEALLQSNPDLITRFHAVEKAYQAVQSGSQPPDEHALPQSFQIIFEDEEVHAGFAT